MGPQLWVNIQESAKKQNLQREQKTRIILLLTRITSFHVCVLERYDIRTIRAIPALRVTSNHAYVISL